MSDEHTSPIKTPKQLALVVFLAFAVPIVLIALLAQLVTGSLTSGQGESESAVLSRIKPVGEVVLAGANTAAAAPASAVPIPTAASPTVAMASAAHPGAGKADGKKIYETVCMACHAAGVAGAPKFSDKAAWAPRLKTGLPSLYNSVLHGKGAMPPRAGTQLSDAELKAGVDFMTAAAK